MDYVFEVTEVLELKRRFEESFEVPPLVLNDVRDAYALVIYAPNVKKEIYAGNALYLFFDKIEISLSTLPVPEQAIIKEVLHKHGFSFSSLENEVIWELNLTEMRSLFSRPQEFTFTSKFLRIVGRQMDSYPLSFTQVYEILNSMGVKELVVSGVKVNKNNVPTLSRHIEA
jgi:hypothetical protein